MREEPASLKTPEINPSGSITSHQSKDRRRMNQIADEMAEKVQKTEKEADRSHHIPAVGPGVKSAP